MIARGLRWSWFVAVYALIVLLHAGTAGMTGAVAGGLVIFQWSYGFGYFVLGAAGYGVLLRGQPGLDPRLGRGYAVLVGAPLAGLDAFLVAPPAGIARLDLWMTALLGLALAAMVARLAPPRLARIWTSRRPDTD